MVDPDHANINVITENDLCISCGACEAACPFGVISIKENELKGIYEPVIVDETNCLSCERKPCLRVCPSYEEDFVDLAGWTDPSQLIGPWHKLYTCHSRDESIRRRASSGGIIRELTRHLLSNDLVDAVITLEHQEGLDYEPRVYDSVEEFLEGSPGSIYHNITFRKVFEILESDERRFLLIAIPCQLTAIRKWQREQPEKCRGKIVMTIGLICGWMYQRHTVNHFGRHFGILPEQVSNATYRGTDSIGNFVISTPDGDNVFRRRPKLGTHKHAVPYAVAFSRAYSCNRCLLCVEHLNYLADVVVGDAWLERFMDDEMGTSIVIVRDAVQDKHVRALADSGYIHLEPASEQDVIESQGNYFAFGRPAQQVINRLRREGQFYPRFTVQNPETGEADEKVWKTNYVIPKSFRDASKAGRGYRWFRRRLPVYFYRGYMAKARRFGRRVLRRFGISR